MLRVIMGSICCAALAAAAVAPSPAPGAAPASAASGRHADPPGRLVVFEWFSKEN